MFQIPDILLLTGSFNSVMKAVFKQHHFVKESDDFPESGDYLACEIVNDSWRLLLVVVTQCFQLDALPKRS